MEKNITMTILSSAVAFMALLSCHEEELFPVIYGNVTYYKVDTSQVVDFLLNERLPQDVEIVKQIVIGDEIYKPKGVKLHGSTIDKSFTQKIKNKNLAGTNLKYFAIGSSLTSGVRHGGYFNEGMITSYPNLLAIQLGVKEFKMPLFDEQDYNGTGRKIKSEKNPTGGPFQKFTISSNNLGIESITEIVESNKKGTVEKIKKVKLKKYQGCLEDLDVFATPGLVIDRLGFGSNKKSELFLNRIEIKEKNEATDIYGFGILLKKKVDVFTIEVGSQGFIPGESAIPGIPNNREHPALTLAKSLIEGGAKGCVANVPDYSKFPVYHQVKLSDLKKAVYNNPIATTLTEENGELVSFIPNSNIDSMMSPIVNIALKKRILSGGKDFFGSYTESI
ncbi:MAG: hypothetical protein ACI9DJ_001440 [Algoriphagus sp.]|jgi:hypothetical protein